MSPGQQLRVIAVLVRMVVVFLRIEWEGEEDEQ
jgi:hypothetical protein